MGTVRLLVDNHLSIAQYPVTLSPSQEFEGLGSGQAFQVAAGRRWTGWTGLTTNVEYSLAWHHVPLFPRPFDMVVIDRESELTRLIVEVSDDDFVSDQDVFDITLPTSPGTGMLTDALGVRTHEGAWMKRFDTVGGNYGRLKIPAMGAGLKPFITGAWVGQSWSPDLLMRPTTHEKTALIVEERQSTRGGIGRGRGTPRREGSLEIRLTTEWDYEQGRYHLDLIAAGKPFWIIPDDERADESFLAIRTSQLQGLGRERDWFFHSGMISWTELSPLVRETINV